MKDAISLHFGVVFEQPTGAARLERKLVKCGNVKSEKVRWTDGGADEVTMKYRD